MAYLTFRIEDEMACITWVMADKRLGWIPTIKGTIDIIRWISKG